MDSIAFLSERTVSVNTQLFTGVVCVGWWSGRGGGGVYSFIGVVCVCVRGGGGIYSLV